MPQTSGAYGVFSEKRISGGIDTRPNAKSLSEGLYPIRKCKISIVLSPAVRQIISTNRENNPRVWIKILRVSINPLSGGIILYEFLTNIQYEYDAVHCRGPPVAAVGGCGGKCRGVALRG